MPDSWVLCRFSFIAEIFTGNSINETEKQKKYTGLTNGYNYIGTKDVSFDHTVNYNNGVKIPFEQSNFRIAHKFTPLLCIEGGSAGRKIGILQEDVCFGNKLCAFESFGVDPKYIYYFLQSPSFTKVFKEKTTGIIGGVSVNTLKHLLFAVPPLAEQARIVAEIEKFEPLIAEYDKLEQQATKLDDEIYDKLKKSILQYAIQGKLVPQDPNDEPASVLLERIRAEKKAKLGKKYVDSCIYKGDDNCYYEHMENEDVNISDILPLDIPDTWSWVKIGDIAFVTKLAGFEYTKYVAPNLQVVGVPLFKGKNIQNSKINYTFESYIPLSISNELQRSQISKKCILTPYVGTIGNIGIHDKDGIYHLGSNVGKIELETDKITTEEYVILYLKSSYGYAELTKYKKATAQESISIEAIREVYLPLPPLSEQKRIVAKINEIFAML